MRTFRALCLLGFVLSTGAASAQLPQVEPQILTRTDLEGKVTVVDVAARFVTTIHLPATVSSIVVGDPSEFRVEHSEHEPRLVFVKAVSTKPSETNLLVAMTSGREVSLLLVNRGETASPNPVPVDFLVRYEPTSGFSVAPSGFPSALIGETVPLSRTEEVSGAAGSLAPARDAAPGNARSSGLDKLLEQQEAAPLPTLYGERVSEESIGWDQVRAGVSRVIDGGQQVAVLFSVVNPTKRAILLTPPQVQLGGRTTSGKFIRRRKWAVSEQLPVSDFRLSRRRLGPGERADGVVLFERPPYKQSNEMLLLQIAQAGAVDRPALAPIGFGVSTSRESQNGGGN